VKIELVERKTRPCTNRKDGAPGVQGVVALSAPPGLW
jgi:hypothetical protein